MEVQKKEGLLKREFGCLKIVWEIENSFCMTYQNNWEISCPLFTVNGFSSIKWRFILKASKAASDAEYVASVVLERHETGDIVLPVKAFWNLSYERGNIIICERGGIFYTNGRISVSIKNFNRLQEKLQDISTRKFNIEAIFLVTRLNVNDGYEKPDDIGLRSFSEDISKLFDFKGYSDLIVNIGRSSVKGHKAILSAGTRLLKDIIRQYSETNAISVAYSDEKSAENIIHYLYTGDLDYVLKTPSNSINEAIDFFKVKELEKYYMKDELILRTKYEATEFYHKWIITDISTPTGVDSLFSPYFGDQDLSIEFQLRLGRNEVNNDGDIGIYLEGPLPEEWKELYIEFEITDISSYSTNLRKSVRWSLEHNFPPRIEDFLSTDIFRAIYVTCNNTLSISCSLFIPSHLKSLSVLSVRNCLPSYINSEEHYTLLSKRIESLFNTDKYCDLIVKCGNESLRVHKCILSARSPVFARYVCLPENSKVMFLQDIDTAILNIFFLYIYSGVLRYKEFSDVYKLFAASVKFGMMILRYQSIKILFDNINISNVFDTLLLAHAHKESKLKTEAFNCIMFNRSKIQDQAIWEKFKNERDVYEEFKEYVRIQVRNNPEGGLKLDDF